ncbi:PREDICTED: systemin receptor SR160-like [Ipomoea nil]|uniref:systemin receptor SR160-like n=1 Tax=Ipomoea nil TaxID=35883 RepID=UPI00090138A0|nr:PREDICTED: systemin receptor SR160-like [Ipomoea nil]
MLYPHHHALMFFIILLFSSLNYSQSLTTHGDDERGILLRLKQHYWGNPSSLEQWNSTSSPCDWPGISCNFNASVTRISLTGMNIRGSFPASTIICQLNKLVSINFSNNSLFGTIPANLSSCSKLEELDLSANYLSGNIPGDLCTTLVELDLSSNGLVGAVPETLGDCSTLELLDLSNNRFSGKLPVETLLNLTSLKILVLSFNNFVGGLSESLSSMVNLETLDLSSNNISGLIPSGICKDPKNSLKVLYLQKNLFTGPIPESLSNCSQLESLDLSVNYVNGILPSSLGSLLKLKDLMIWLNELEGEIPLELRYLQSLERLLLAFNGLSGSIPESLSNCTNLKFISLLDNLLSGAIPASLGLLSNLTILELAKNSLSGSIPVELGNCSSLLWLDMNTNFLNGSIPPALFKQFGNIAILHVKQFRFIWYDGSEYCQSTSFFEFDGITEDRLDRILTRNPCNGTKHYKYSVSIPIFHHNGSMIFLDLSYNKLEGSIPKELGSMQYLNILNLGHNHLSGPIPQELGGLEYVESLYLSYNRLNGSIPQTLTNLIFLTGIDLSNNQLSGAIPCAAQFLLIPEKSFANNSGLYDCHHPHYGQESSPSSISKSSRSKKKQYIIIGCGVIAGVLIWLVTQLLVIRLAGKGRMENDGEEWSMVSFQRLGFNKWDILGGLTDQNLVGNGGSGKVYRVITKKGKKVAVKSIRHERNEGHILEKQFTAEVQILGKIWHNNIVKLLCCIRGKTTKLIVYEYMDKNCLHKWLHGKKKGLSTQVLHWETRLKVAIGAAQGLCYMHHNCNPPIVHRDIKSSNILMDSDFNAKIADFGLAKMLASEGDPETASAIVGTFGYIAPEYGSTRKVDAKSDIYSFGVVLLELTTGREAVIANEDINLAQWAHKHQREGNAIADALDEEMKDPCYLEAMITVFKLGLTCTLNSPSSRPSMKDISQILQRCSETNHMSPGS